MTEFENEVLPLEEAYRKYPRQWLAAEVEERDKDSGQPTKVRLIGRHMDLYQVRASVKHKEFCSIYTGPIPEVRHKLMF